MTEPLSQSYPVCIEHGEWCSEACTLPTSAGISSSVEGVPSAPAVEAPEVTSSHTAVGTDTSGALETVSAEEFTELWKIAMLSYDSARPRSLQSDSGVLGASDALGCQHRAVLTVQRTPPSDVAEKGAAITGTMLHEVALPAFGAVSGALIEQDLMLTLPSGGKIPVHPDIVWADDCSITDLKTVADLNARRRLGPEDKHLAQVNLYALACLQNGLVDREPTVRILYVSRENVLESYVHQEPFSMGWVRRADDWFEGVRYAVTQGDEGVKDANPNFCRRFCGFVSICRPPLQDASGELQNEELRRRVLVGHEARKQRKHFEAIEKEAVSEIRGVSGTVGSVRVVSTHVNAANPYTKTEFFDV